MPKAPEPELSGGLGAQAGGYKRLGDMLVEEGLITEQNLQDAVVIQRERGGFLGKLLVELGYITEEQVVSCLVKQCKIPHLNLQDYNIDTQVFHLLPLELCRDYSLVPIDKLGRILTVAMVDPLNVTAIEAVRQLYPNLRIKPILCSWHDYEQVLAKMSQGPTPRKEGEPELIGTFMPQPIPGAAPEPEPATPVEVVKAQVDPLDASQTMQHAGRSRTRSVPQEEATPVLEPAEDSIGEDVLREIVVAAVQDVVSTALMDIRRQLNAIEDAIRTQKKTTTPRQPLSSPASSTFKDLASSMRRSFGLDVGGDAETPESDEQVSLQQAQEIAEDVFGEIRLNSPMPDMLFSCYFPGNTNDFTLAVCKKVAANPAKEYNPLYLYGGVGVGKTHLANATANAMLELNPDLRIAYLPAAQFLERMEQAIRYGQLEAFRAHYAAWNTLIFDDIDLIAEHHAAQEELLYLVDVLTGRGCQLILVGHTAPELLEGVESRLKSRLSNGLVAEVKPADAEGRRAILAHLVPEEDKAKLPASVVELIVSLADEDVRAMQGCLHKTLAMVKLADKAPDEQGLADQVRQMLAAGAA